MKFNKNIKKLMLLIGVFSLLSITHADKKNWKDTPFNLKQILEIKVPSVMTETEEEFFDEYTDAIEDYRDGDYIDAGDGFNEAYFFAEKENHKICALYMGLKSFIQGDYKYDQYKIIKKIVSVFPIDAPFDKLIDKELEIADSYLGGYRQPAFQIFFLSWMEGNDKATEIYEEALIEAPFSKNANKARLDLATIYLEDDEIEKAIEEYQFLIKNQVDSKEAVEAYLSLADIFIQQSRIGDGDSANARKALSLLDKIKIKFPKHKDIEWVENSFATVENYTARHLYNIAYFYYKLEKKEAAGMYLTKLFVICPGSDYVAPAEKLAKAIKKDNWTEEKVVIKILPNEKKEIDKYPVFVMEEKERAILKITDKDKWLLPMPDIKKNKKESILEGVEDDEK